jgi:NADP-dependent aldehyde dehydrogenase
MPFHAINPQTGDRLEPAYASASIAEVLKAIAEAQAAFPVYSGLSGRERAAFLRAIAAGLDGAQQTLAERAHLETALPMPRLLGEVTRTSNQLRLFADLLEEGSWVGARLDCALPDRKPMPRPGIRSMRRALGPVAVFGASNFPLAFSTAGGDTASALAAGCPVLFKAHPAHPGTSELVAGVIAEATEAAGLPKGVFCLLFDAGIEVGKTLVEHPGIDAVAFTGSLRAGRALMALAAARPRPIPCFTEMSSGNPVFVLPGTLTARAAQIAAELFGSYTLGAGQFCTKPGLVFLPETEQTPVLLRELCARVEQAAPFTMLTKGIACEYQRATKARSAAAAEIARGRGAFTAPAHSTTARLFEVSLDKFLAHPELAEEIFGPDTLIIRCATSADMVRAAEALEGHLTATVFGEDEELIAHRSLVAVLERKAGRVIFNAYPTGVEVCHAMVHGGPYPATSDPRFTSVGTLAIERFTRPVCFQDCPEALLPAELQQQNPLGILRLIDGRYER